MLMEFGPIRDTSRDQRSHDQRGQLVLQREHCYGLIAHQWEDKEK